MATVKTLADMSADERSLLLFFEACAVDNTGLIDGRRMNDDDFVIAKRWHDEGFCRFGRIYSKHIMDGRFSKPYSNWVELTPEFFTLAHQERIARAERMLAKRDWLHADEK